MTGELHAYMATGSLAAESKYGCKIVVSAHLHARIVKISQHPYLWHCLHRAHYDIHDIHKTEAIGLLRKVVDSFDSSIGLY